MGETDCPRFPAAAASRTIPRMGPYVLPIVLPDWLQRHLDSAPAFIPAIEDRMRFVIELSRMNVEHGSGGPFGAAVFRAEEGRLIAAGVNLVTHTGVSIAHAELIAISFAQRRLGHYDLGAPEQPSMELVTSTEPCAMCLGAIPWSGVKRVVCGADEADARAIGFDEGDKPQDWPALLEHRGIALHRHLFRAEAAAVLQAYAERGGMIY